MEPILLFGQAGAAVILQGDSGYTDDGTAYVLRGKSNRVAPAGMGGEAIFPAFYIGITHTMAVDLVFVPYVNDVALDPITLSLTAKSVRTLEPFEIALSVPVLDTAGAERARCAPRGTWFQMLVYDDGLGTGDLVLEVGEVEYEVVQESLDATV